MNYKLTLLFYLFATYTSLSQTLSKDGTNDSTEVKRLNALCKAATGNGKFDSAFYYTGKALRLAVLSGDNKNLATSVYQMGKIYQKRWETEKAIRCFQLAGSFYKKSGDAKGYAMCDNVTGICYNNLGDYAKAIECHFNALRHISAISDTNLIISAYNNLGSGYEALKDLDNSMLFHKKALRLVQLRHDSMRMGSILGNIGVIYDKRKAHDEAILYYGQAMHISRRVGNEELEANMLANIGAAYEDKGDYQKALDYQLKVIDIRKKLGDEGGLVPTIYNIGTIYYKIGNSARALEYAKETNAMARKLNILHYIETSENLLNEQYAGLGQYDKAYGHYKNYIGMRDSLYNEENTRKSVQTRMNYEFEKKQMELSREQLKKDAEAEATRRKQQLIIWVVSGSLILLSVIAFLLMRQFRFRNREREMQLEQKLLRSQMNPHFIFNSLQAIQNFILKHNEKDAVRYLGSFASITRSVLENSRMEKIPLRKEVGLLGNYLQLQKLRFGEKFEYEVQVDDAISQDEVYIPPMLSQPFIENALEHGMNGIESGGLIKVHFSMQGEALVLEIVDNGYGMQASKKQEKDHTSLAMTITRERIELMNRKSDSKMVFTVTDAYPGAERVGVKVRFIIPLPGI